uniref:CASP-like protein n=1 Tax=Oryza punctata TaxID=4537 RepID=A0A0E0K558_ORYPU
MGTTNQTLPFFTQFLRFKAQYSDLQTLTLFVVANSAVDAYLVMLALVAAAASAAAAIVYLAHKGNVRDNWFAVCQQFDSFCERISGSLIGFFSAMAVLLLLVLLSAFALARR